MWGVAGLFEELSQQSCDFLKELFLRIKQVDIYDLGAAEHLSPFLGENIPKKRGEGEPCFILASRRTFI